MSKTLRSTCYDLHNSLYLNSKTLMLNWLEGFPGSSDSKESTCNVGDLGSVPGLGRFPGGGHGNPPVFLPRESPWTEEPGGLQSMKLQRAGHD